MLANMAQWAMIFGGFGGRSNDREEGGMGGLGALIMIILAPIAAMLIQMAISRSREYEADAGGAKLCGNPLWLANALRKLEIGNKRIPMNANPATAHMFIVSPLHGGGMMSLFSTHPPMEERIARLEGMVYSR
jgi:heat shock protein HtpX